MFFKPFYSYICLINARNRQPTNQFTKLCIVKLFLRIAENFDIAVKNEMADFCKLIKKQVVEQLNLPNGIVQDIYVTQGKKQSNICYLNATKQIVNNKISLLMLRIHIFILFFFYIVALNSTNLPLLSVHLFRVQ